jgi:hypothetical protein
MLLVPSCAPCNELFGRVENEARTIALALNPNGALTDAVQEKAKASISPELAGNDIDRGARTKRRDTLEAGLTTMSLRGQESGLWSAHGSPQMAYVTLSSGLCVPGIPAMSLNPAWQPTMVEHWMRGCYWHVERRALPASTPWKHFSPTTQAVDIPQLTSELASAMPLVFGRPEFRVWGVLSPSDSSTSVWMFGLWDQLVFWAASGALTLAEPFDILRRAGTWKDERPSAIAHLAARRVPRDP